MENFGEWKKLYCAPKSKDSGGEPFGLGRLSPRDSYRLARSMERYKRRPDKFDDRPLILQGEVGRIDGVRFIKGSA